MFSRIRVKRIAIPTYAVLRVFDLEDRAIGIEGAIDPSIDDKPVQ